MNIHILTYATHADGSYDKMMEDAKEQKLKISVLGWNEEWRGYFGKLEAVSSKVASYDADDIVIVIDAFDTRINGNMDRISQIVSNHFKDMDIVFSRAHVHSLPISMIGSQTIGNYLNRRIFGGVLNAGLYMGRAGALTKLYNDAFKLKDKCNGDDQCAFNKLKDKHNIHIDSENKLFLNVEYNERDLDHKGFDSVFCGYPATLTLKRIKRMTYEYAPFLWREILAVIVLITTISIVPRTMKMQRFHKGPFQRKTR